MCFFYFLIIKLYHFFLFFFFQAEDGIRDGTVTGVQTCALPILEWSTSGARRGEPARLECMQRGREIGIESLPRGAFQREACLSSASFRTRLRRAGTYSPSLTGARGSRMSVGAADATTRARRDLPARRSSPRRDRRVARRPGGGRARGRRRASEAGDPAASRVPRM